MILISLECWIVQGKWLISNVSDSRNMAKLPEYFSLLSMDGTEIEDRTPFAVADRNSERVVNGFCIKKPHEEGGSSCGKRRGISFLGGVLISDFLSKRKKTFHNTVFSEI